MDVVIKGFTSAKIIQTTNIIFNTIYINKTKIFIDIGLAQCTALTHSVIIRSKLGTKKLRVVVISNKQLKTLILRFSDMFIVLRDMCYVNESCNETMYQKIAK